jgi:tetrapyrrole methylase family protein/MazG family protein
MESEKSVSNLVETVHRLRAPGGCPWDQKQTHQSLRPYLIEEAYEVLDVLDQIQTDDQIHDPKIGGPFKEELGDLLMQVVLHSELAAERGAFNFYDVAQGLNEKLIRRHPHVFGDAQAENETQALSNWENEKAKEKSAGATHGEKNPSVLEGLPASLPALQRAHRTIEKVTRVGFQWSDLKGPLDKVEEEIKELRIELERGNHKKAHEEMGDLLFSLCNIAFMTKINPEDALRGFLKKFEGRFRYIESELHKKGSSPQKSTLEEMDHLWSEAKNLEKK